MPRPRCYSGRALHYASGLRSLPASPLLGNNGIRPFPGAAPQARDLILMILGAFVAYA